MLPTVMETCEPALPETGHSRGHSGALAAFRKSFSTEIPARETFDFVGLARCTGRTGRWVVIRHRTYDWVRLGCRFRHSL